MQLMKQTLNAQRSTFYVQLGLPSELSVERWTLSVERFLFAKG